MIIKKIILTFLTLVLVLTMGNVWLCTASAAQSGDFIYFISNYTARITGYDGAGGEVNIPDTLGGYPVTCIGTSAFSGCTTLTGVTIPNSVTSIGASAFYGCTGLTEAVIPDSVTQISDSMFSGCVGLTSISIGSGVANIGYRAFRGCTGLKQIIVDSSNTRYSSVDGVLFNKIEATLLQYPSGKAGNYIIPDNVIGIDKHAFADCTGLTSVTIPNSVASIGEYVFSNCTRLNSVTIPSSVTNIDSFAFYGCTGLAELAIPNSVASIGSSAFAGCTGLSRVTIGSGVSNIGIYAFKDCTGLTAAYFLGNAPEMPDFVFLNCGTGFKVYYISGNTGFTNPWHLYRTATFIPDLTPPQLMIEHKGGIYNSDKNITITSSEEAEVYYTTDGSDPTVSSEKYSNSIFIDKSTILRFIAVDRAGNKSETYTENFVIDKVKPITLINTSGEPGDNDWYKSNVVVVLSSEDDLCGSGIAKTEYSFDGLNWSLYTEPITISTEGITKLYYKASDKAANEEAANSKEIKIDKTIPGTSLNGFENGSKVTLGSGISINWSANDLHSELATASTGTIALDTSSAGKHISIITAADKAGNTTNFELTYYVVYQYSGVLQPIKIDGTSKFKIGSTIPVKFAITDINNNFIDNAVAKVYLMKVGGHVPSEGEAIVASTSAATDGNQFRYDYTDNQYIFNLSTKNLNLDEGEYQTTIKLDDGQSYICQFYLKSK